MIINTKKYIHAIYYILYSHEYLTEIYTETYLISVQRFRNDIARFSCAYIYIYIYIYSGRKQSTVIGHEVSLTLYRFFIRMRFNKDSVFY